MRSGRLFLVLAAGIASVAGCASSSSPSSSTSTTAIAPNARNGIETKSGDQIVAAAVAATKQQRSFHFVETAGEGTSHVLVVGDIGTASGEQHVTIYNGKNKNGHLTLILSGKVAYVEGDVVGLEGFTGLSAKLSAQFAGKWISVPSSNQSFGTIAGTLAVGTAAAQLVKLPGTLTRGATSTQLGHAAVAVKAAQSSTSGSLELTIYVATTGEALPILVAGTTTASGSAARSISATFSDWGEAVNVITPSASVPIAQIQAAAG